MLWFMMISFSWDLWYGRIMCQICFVSFGNLMLLFFGNLMLQAFQLWSIIEIIQFLWALICFLCMCSTSLFHDCSLEQILILLLYINLYTVLYFIMKKNSPNYNNLLSPLQNQRFHAKRLLNICRNMWVVKTL